MQTVTSSFATPLRWSARILGGVIVLFWGFFLLAHLFGDAGSPSRPLIWADYLSLGGIIISVIGLAMAWKWELTGAIVTLIAFSIVAAVNWRVAIFPGTVIPIAALLFLASWWLHCSPQTDDALLK